MKGREEAGGRVSVPEGSGGNGNEKLEIRN